jgi:Flp pilus assembly protein TadG
MPASNKPNQNGQVAVLVGVLLLVLIGFVGISIDSGRAYGVKAKLNSAVDAAGIAAARALAEGASDSIRIENAKSAANNFYLANFPAQYLGAVPVSPVVSVIHNPDGYWQVDVAGSANMPLTFMSIFGFTDVPVAATGQTIRRDLDIVLVMDTSGSLGPPTSSLTTLDTLKSAAVNFVNRFNEGINGDRVGLVSFASGGVVDVPIVKTGARGFDKSSVVNAINALSLGGATASAEGMRLGLNEINAIPVASRSSLRMLVFFSDGAPNMVNAVFDNGGSNLTGDLYSEAGGGADTRAIDVFRHDERNTKTTTTSDIAILPASGLSVNGLGNILLASYNNRRTLSGSPYTNSQCNVNKAARNMLENVANTARDQAIKVYAIGLGARINSLEVNYCDYGPEEHGSSILRRLANASGVDTYDPAQASGLYIWAEDEGELSDAFTTIASEILRLSK